MFYMLRLDGDNLTIVLKPNTNGMSCQRRAPYRVDAHARIVALDVYPTVPTVKDVRGATSAAP